MLSQPCEFRKKGSETHLILINSVPPYRESLSHELYHGNEPNHVDATPGDFLHDPPQTDFLPWEELSGNSDPLIDPNGFFLTSNEIIPSSPEFPGSFPISETWDFGLAFNDQPESEIAASLGDFAALPDQPMPAQLGPDCPSEKRAFCCTGGRTESNIGKDCDECMMKPFPPLFPSRFKHRPLRFP
jgi:hypothetical protein